MMAAAASVLPQTARVPAALQPLFRAIHSAAPDALLVGGALRDFLSGRTPRDVDVVTHADAREAASALAIALEGHAFPLDEERAYYRVTLPGGAPAVQVDISGIDNLSQDLARRDFTINALAAPIQRDGGLGEVIDEYAGVRDIEARIVRMTAVENLEDDPLRLLRAVRFATQLSYEIEPATAGAIRLLAPRVTEAAPERVRDELLHLFSTPHAARGLRLADDLGLLDVLLPELTPARGVEQPSNHHYYDVFEHSLQAVAALDEMLDDIATATGRPWLGPEFRNIMAGFDVGAYLREHTGGVTRFALLKLAALLHDVSKPETKAVHSDGRIRFLGHPEQGAVKADAICRQLRLGNRETRFVSLLVEEHLRPTMLAQPGQPPSRRAIYRFLRDLGEALPACLILSLADGAAAAGPRLQRDCWQGHIAYCRYVLYEASRIDSPEQQSRDRIIDGNDLISELGLEPGPVLGRVLSQVEEAFAVGEIETRAEAIDYARTLVGTLPSPTPSPLTERGLSDAGLAGRPRGERWLTSPDRWDQLRPAAREFRSNPTEAENALWQRLRRNQVDGLAFRHQHVIDRFIVDFYCSKAKLVIEVDGPVHDSTVDEDAERQQFLEALGLKVLRFSNEQVMNQLDSVLEHIQSTALARTRTPSPPAGRGQGEGSSSND